MKRTKLRHRILDTLRLDPGAFTVRRDFTTWKPVYSGRVSLSGGERRALRDMDEATLLCRGYASSSSAFATRPLSLSVTGEQLLDQWDEKYGRVSS